MSDSHDQSPPGTRPHSYPPGNGGYPGYQQAQPTQPARKGSSILGAILALIVGIVVGAGGLIGLGFAGIGPYGSSGNAFEAAAQSCDADDILEIDGDTAVYTTTYENSHRFSCLMGVLDEEGEAIWEYRDLYNMVPVEGEEYVFSLSYGDIEGNDPNARPAMLTVEKRSS